MTRKHTKEVCKSCNNFYAILKKVCYLKYAIFMAFIKILQAINCPLIFMTVYTTVELGLKRKHVNKTKIFSVSCSHTLCRRDTFKKYSKKLDILLVIYSLKYANNKVFSRMARRFRVHKFQNTF